MKFHKNITGGPVTLPTAAVKLCGLEAGGRPSYTRWRGRQSS